MTSRSRAHVALEGALNCRDIGGYPTADGRTVRTDAIFRCDKLSMLTDDDLEELADLGIRTVVDFRADHEVEKDPSRLWPTVTTHAPLPMGNDVAQQGDFLQKILAHEITEFTEADMGEMYVEMLTTRTEEFATFLRIVADFEHLPALFHCTAGKDRTGLGAALIHELLGVDRELVLDDYEWTNELRTKHRIPQLRPQLEEAGVDVDAILPALSAPRAALAIALEWIDAQHGTVEDYARNALGIDEETIELLRLQMTI